MTHRRRSGVMAMPLAIALILGACGADSDAGDRDPAPDAVVTDPSHAGAVNFDGTHVSIEDFMAATDSPGTVILDVRTPAEFAEGHLPHAINIDVSAPDFAERISELDADASYAVYCRTDNRSQVALEVMAGQGFSSVVGMTGGIVAWPGSIVRP